MSVEPSNSIRSKLESMTWEKFFGIISKIPTPKKNSSIRFPGDNLRDNIFNVIFDSRYRYKGDWNSSNVNPVQTVNATPFNGEFKNNNGDMVILYQEEPDNSRYARMRFLDGDYIDQNFGFIVFNLTNSTYNDTTAQIRFHQSDNITLASNLGNTFDVFNCDIEAEFSFTNSETGKPWSVNDKLHSLLKTDMKITSKPKYKWDALEMCNLSFKSETTLEYINIVWPLVYVVSIFLGAAMNI